MVVCAYKQQLQKPGKNDLRLLIIKSAYKISTYSLKNKIRDDVRVQPFEL